MIEGQDPVIQSTKSNSMDHNIALNRVEADGDAPADKSPEFKALPPLADQIVDKAIDNMTRKLISGYRNKNTAKPNAKSTDYVAESKEALKATSAASVMQVVDRGQMWK